MLVAAAEQGLELDDDLAVRRDERRRSGAVHALRVDDRGHKRCFPVAGSRTKNV